VIAQRRLLVVRSAPAGRDAEGRALRGPDATVAIVLGHLVRREITTSNDGRILTEARYRALLPVGTDVAVTDLIVPADTEGERYRVNSITTRRTPAGAHHLSVECERTV
jgi:hypothetical protein